MQPIILITIISHLHFDHSGTAYIVWWKMECGCHADSFHFKYPGPYVPACHCQSSRLCIPFSLSLLSFLLFSFSLSGLSGTAAECLSELMAFLSREKLEQSDNYSHSSIQNQDLPPDPLNTTRGGATVNTYLPLKSLSPAPPTSFHTFRWRSASSGKVTLTSIFPSCICIIHEFPHFLGAGLLVSKLAQLTFRGKPKKESEGGIDSSIFKGTKDKRR